MERIICYRILKENMDNIRHFQLSNGFAFNDEVKKEILSKVRLQSGEKISIASFWNIRNPEEEHEGKYIDCICTLECHGMETTMREPNEEEIKRCYDYHCAPEPPAPKKTRKRKKTEDG